MIGKATELTVGIHDRRRAIHAEIPDGIADAVVAALAADPETIDELETALGRFMAVDPEIFFFAGWLPGGPTEDAERHTLVIDLPARLVAHRSSQWAPVRAGQARFHAGHEPTDVWLPYRIADDWLLTERLGRWRELAAARRRERAAYPPLDARSVLYGRVAEFLVAECVDHAGAAVPPLVAIHARWLTTQRNDLQNQSPRDVMMARRALIDAQLQDQQQHWSRLNRCPPGLDRRSAAYRLGGFGTHEFVVYYDLVRHLLETCWERIGPGGKIDVAAEIRHLEQLQQEWLHTPQEELEGHSPTQIIDRERARLPMVGSPAHLIGDDGCDCPICQMMADSGAPMFWCLDGAHMEDEFAFSSCGSRAEWEGQRRKWQAAERHWAAQRRAGDDDDQERHPDRPATVWQSSYFDAASIDGWPSREAIAVQLFAVGARIAELGEDLGNQADFAGYTAALHTHFDQLRQIIGAGSWWLAGPRLADFCDDLVAIAEVRPDLKDKCTDLAALLETVSERAFEVAREGGP